MSFIHRFGGVHNKLIYVLLFLCQYGPIPVIESSVVSVYISRAFGFSSIGACCSFYFSSFDASL